MEMGVTKWKKLRDEANWSKCAYTYGMSYVGAALSIPGVIFIRSVRGLLISTSTGSRLERSGGTYVQSARFDAAHCRKIHSIRGTSQPNYFTLATILMLNLSQKFAARKAKKFFTQENRLLLPALELGYHFLCIARAPRRFLLRKMLPAIQVARAKILEHLSSPMTYYNAKYFWDDYCLAHFLYAVSLRYAVHPVRSSVSV